MLWNGRCEDVKRGWRHFIHFVHIGTSHITCKHSISSFFNMSPFGRRLHHTCGKKYESIQSLEYGISLLY